MESNSYVLGVEQYLCTSGLVITMRKQGKRHTTLSIPVELFDQVQQLIKDSKMGYDSVAEFAKEAIRIHMLTYKPTKEEITKLESL